MQRFSMAFAIAFGLLCASQFSSVFAKDCASGQCRDDAGDEETALVQTKLQQHRRQAQLDHSKLPGLSNITDAITQVTDAVAGAAVTAILSVMDAVKSQLMSMEVAVEPYVKLANESSTILEQGLESILGQAFDVTIAGAVEEDQEKVTQVLDEIESVWTKVSSSLTETSTSIDGLLSLVGSSADGVKAEVDSTIQAVLDSVNGVITKIETVDQTIESLVNVTKEILGTTGTAASLLEANQTKTKTDPSALLEELNAEVSAVTDQVSAFGAAFSGMFETIFNSVDGILKEVLTTDEYAQVAAAFADVESLASNLSNEVVGATNELFGSISTASAAASEALAAAEKSTEKSGASGQLWSRWGLSAAASAVFAAMAV